MARVVVLLVLVVCCSSTVAVAAQLRARTLTVEAGRIADAALAGDGRLYLCYPDAGYVAQYSAGGKLERYIRREAGVSRPFQPTALLLGGDGMLQVFDEVSHELLLIKPDGNQMGSHALAYPVDGQPLALSRIGGLLAGPDAALWALLPDRAALCRFDGKGALQEQLDLAALLPYPAALYTRAQWLADGTLLLLDYNQGAVLYRRPGTTQFRRLALQRPAGIEALPAAQDFAADSAGRILMLTSDSQHPAVLLTPGATGYGSAAVQLPAALAGRRLGCRRGGAGYVVWAREGGIVCLCEAP